MTRVPAVLQGSATDPCLGTLAESAAGPTAPGSAPARQQLAGDHIPCTLAAIMSIWPLQLRREPGIAPFGSARDACALGRDGLCQDLVDAPAREYEPQRIEADEHDPRVHEAARIEVGPP